MIILDRYSNINLDSFSGHSKYRNGIEHSIYTDGSKTKEGVGSRFVVYRQNIRVHTESVTLPDHPTVFQAEITDL